MHLPEVQKINLGSTFSLQPVHNIYLLVLSETGIVGLAMFGWLILKTWQKVKSEKPKVPEGLKVQSYILLSIVLILGLFDHYFLTLQQGQLLFCFTLGLCWNRFVK